MAEKWIKGAIKRPGAFRAKAEKAGMSTQEYARSVSAHPDKHDTRTVRQANLAKELGRMGGRRSGRRSTRRSGRR